MLLTVPFFGLIWGFFTGTTGGLLFFGIGAIGGMIWAIPVGMVAFPLFAIFHRLLQCNRLIERGLYLPIAFGIILTIAAFILSTN
jgi:uncharacterized membrane protein YedE/YeeE